MTVEGTVTIPLSEYEAMQRRLESADDGAGYGRPLCDVSAISPGADGMLTCSCGQDRTRLQARIEELESETAILRAEWQLELARERVRLAKERKRLRKEHLNALEDLFRNLDAEPSEERIPAPNIKGGNAIFPVPDEATTRVGPLVATRYEGMTDSASG